MKKLCIFDLDGTLTNTITAISHFGNTALSIIGLPPIKEELYKKMVGDGRTVLIHRMLQFYKSDTEENFVKVCAQYDKNYEADPMYKTKAYDGIKSMLDKLLKNDIGIAVCSNKPDNVVKDVVRMVFGDTFDLVHGAEDKKPVKPDPYCALKIAKEAGMAAEDCFFVGDTNVDMYTAANANMTSIGVLWGFRDRKELVEAGAEYIAENPDEVAEIILGHSI